MTLLVTLALFALGACAAGPTNPAPVALPAPAAPPASPPVAAEAAAAPSAPVAVRDIDVAALKAALERPVLLVDVRTPAEFAGGHVPGAKNVPIDELDARLGELGAPGDPVYVICQSGGRSARASASLAEKGYPAVNVTGGTGAWRAAGYPVE